MTLLPPAPGFPKHPAVSWHTEHPDTLRHQTRAVMGWGFGADSVPLWELPEVTFLGGQGRGHPWRAGSFRRQMMKPSVHPRCWTKLSDSTFRLGVEEVRRPSHAVGDQFVTRLNEGWLLGCPHAGS